MRDVNSTGRSDSPICNHTNQGRYQQNDSDRSEIPEPQTTDFNDQAGQSGDAKAMASAFEPLNRSLDTFLTRLPRTSERSEKSRRLFKKPRCYKDESDGCRDIWIGRRLEEEDLTERQ